jgi:2-methylcitrate dehydratase PrpD
MGQAIERLARFVAQTGWDDIPMPVREHAKLVLLDTFGVTLAGSRRPEVAALRDALGRGAGAGATLFASGWKTHDPRTAALLNGIAGRAIELCEGLRLVSGQAAMQVLPGILALAQARAAPGRDVLSALVLGYEAAGKLCTAFKARPLAHQNGQAALLAAAAGGAKVAGLDAAGVSRAMRISTTLLLTPSYTNAVAGATALNVAGGMSGFVGALAPELAQAGFTAQTDAVEEAFEHMVGTGFDPQPLLGELGAPWQITQNYFRLYACCNPIHPALDALHEVVARLRPRPQEVERIDIATYRFAAVMNNPSPPNFFASKYSLPHACAVLLVRGKLGHAAMDDSALEDADIAALRARVRIVEDAAMSARAPRLRPARVTLSLKDGRSATHAVESHRGDFDAPFARQEILDKFRELAAQVLSDEGVRRAEAMLLSLETIADVRAGLASLRPHVRPD